MDKQNTSADVQDVPSGIDALRTNGIRHNRKLQFKLSLTGDEIHRTTKVLEELAVESRCYLQVRECVLLAERIRAEARKQGY